ncbi:hypothetical protein LZC95_08750 [Pendulispora brunnea]|uniref:Uncharacterized protein n=1 Tax=Pendulispora brunnea TaxID=2905690 RepID=A0ABZ2KH69_9BACT
MRKWISISGAFSAGALFCSASAWGAAVITAPVPRTPACDETNCKVGPCGGQNPASPKYKFEKGSDLTVTWNETTDQIGCYIVELSTTGDDQNFQVLKTLADDTNSVPESRSATIPITDLPKVDGGPVECEHCVLRVRQIAAGVSAGCGADTDASTYYSCADIIIGTDASVSGGGTPGPGVPDAGSPNGGNQDAGNPGNPDENGAGEDEVLDPTAGRGCAASPLSSGLSYGGIIAVAMTLAASVWHRARRRSSRRR